MDRELEDDGLRPEYDFSEGTRGKHYRAYRRGTTVVLSKEDQVEASMSLHEGGMEREQVALDLRGEPTAGEILDRIRGESRDEVEKGRWFENLFMHVARQEPELEVAEIWRWAEWPERSERTGLDGRDIGVDLVARRHDGSFVAIQCKCYDENRILPKGEIDKFLGATQQGVFGLRWIVGTCRWNPNAEAAILNARPHVAQIDFGRFHNVQLVEEAAERPVREPLRLQKDAISDTVEGLRDHARGRLVMACGTGKTFTALRVAEQIVETDGRILFAAPTIALVSQARREWLRHTVRPLHSLVVCSDPFAGGSREEDMRVSELECSVTTDPAAIASLLREEEGTKVVFCTYHSLSRVTEAQHEHEAPAFDLAIADEAHRTTGVSPRETAGSSRRVDFREIHDDGQIRAESRLYMTATPRMYTAASRSKMQRQGHDIVDMGDFDIYGPELHRLSFAKAVDERMLSDYRVIVLGVHQSSVTPRLRRRLAGLDDAETGRNAPTVNDMARVLGVALAVNGVTEGTNLDKPGPLPRTLAFANSIRRSKWYVEAFQEPEVLRATTRRMAEGRAMRVEARHLDARHNVHVRNTELQALDSAPRRNECRIVSNVKLFTEGVDVPSLNAVAFLDSRDSQVDVVQAVGRVMRRAEGKRFGYIIVPVVVEPGKDVISALESGTEGYQTVGRVLRALQSHDGRLAEDVAKFVQVYDSRRDSAPGNGASENEAGAGESGLQGTLNLQEVGQGIFAHVAKASGLGKPGKLVADEITYTVKQAASMLEEQELEDEIASALGIDGNKRSVCTIGSLLLCNACLLHRRLRDVPEMGMIPRLDKASGAKEPAEILAVAWESILGKDYRPVFEPALAVLNILRDRPETRNTIRVLVECANRLADSLSELGLDHAGPLYHSILPHGTSDGAFYTNNLTALMLARLALPKDFVDWSDAEAVGKLRIMDPACGTGTLLMGALHTVKARVWETRDEDAYEGTSLHKRLVEDVLCGLDINPHAIQLAACNMTLGAPTVDYRQMNLHTMRHGVDGEGRARAGSLEILARADTDLVGMAQPLQGLEYLEAEQVDGASQNADWELRNLDAVLMNPPFSVNTRSSAKYGAAGQAAMRKRESAILKEMDRRDPMSAKAVTRKAVRTFFSPLADHVLGKDKGTLAMVMPYAGVTSSTGAGERRFLANRFQVSAVITSHDPKHLNFSENTSIHECLLICCRKALEERGGTAFVSLARMPEDIAKATEVADAISTGSLDGDWGQCVVWERERVEAGDWSPAQWLDGTLGRAAQAIARLPMVRCLGDLAHVGPAHVRNVLRNPLSDPSIGSFRVLWRHEAQARQTMLTSHEFSIAPMQGKERTAERAGMQADHLLVANRFRTTVVHVTAVLLDSPALGSVWTPVKPRGMSEEVAWTARKAWCAWLNSTPGVLGFMHRRGRTLDYPDFMPRKLQSMPCPDPSKAELSPLVAAYEKLQDHPLLPWRHMNECPVRTELDIAAAQTAGMDPGMVADWRHRLAREPSVTGRRYAPQSG